MTAQPRKRAPGGGRKPKGPAAMRSQFTLRMPGEMRAELVAAANARGRPGWTLTDELLLRLRQSFVRDVEQRRQPALHALCFLIGKIAETLTPVSVEEGSKHLDPFWFASFRLAVGKLLDALQPPGEVRQPVLPPELLSLGVNMFSSPERVAKTAASSVLMELARPEPPALAVPLLMPANMLRLVRRFHNQDERNFYSMIRAKADLGLGPPN